MTVFGFWNLRGRSLQGLVHDLIVEHAVDVMVLAECRFPAAEVVALLERQPRGYRHARMPPGVESNTTLVTRLGPRSLKPFKSSGRRLAIWRIVLPNVPEIVLATAHLPSRLHYERSDLDELAPDWARELRSVEAKRSHDRTLLVGDLNMDPYDRGLVSTAGLHAVPTKALAMQGTRTVQGHEHRLFYNPMWSRFGDDSPGPPGTYFYRQATPFCPFWHMFDQVLIRPSLAEAFEPRSLRILDAIAGSSLLDEQGEPRKTEDRSDHLPLVFELKLEVSAP